MKCLCGGDMRRALPGAALVEVRKVIKTVLGNPRYSRKQRLRKKFDRQHKEKTDGVWRVAVGLEALRRPTYVCEVCGRQDSLTMAVAHNMFPIQPMPPGALPVYYGEGAASDTVSGGMPRGELTSCSGTEPTSQAVILTEAEKQELIQKAIKTWESGKSHLWGGLFR